MKGILYVCCCIALLSCHENKNNDPNIVDTSLMSGILAPAVLSYRVIAQHPHDETAYTQGLQLYQGKMYEGTGDFENSSLRITDYKTGKVEFKHMMGTKDIFGEGITILHDTLYQLTWQNNIVYVYSLKDLSKPVKTYHWPYEGWGITNNGTDLIISDGVNPNLYFVDPATFKIKSTVGVADNNGPVYEINELEYVDGYVYANKYTTNVILKIDPVSGHVVGIMHFDNLLPESEKKAGITDYFNGIAYDSTSKTFFITGKRWPKLYEIQIN